MALGASGVGAVAGFAGALFIHLSQLAAAAHGSCDAALGRLRQLVTARAIGDVQAVRLEYGGNASGEVFVIIFNYLCPLTSSPLGAGHSLLCPGPYLLILPWASPLHDPYPFE